MSIIQGQSLSRASYYAAQDTENGGLISVLSGAVESIQALETAKASKEVELQLLLETPLPSDVEAQSIAAELDVLDAQLETLLTEQDSLQALPPEPEAAQSPATQAQILTAEVRGQIVATELSELRVQISTKEEALLETDVRKELEMAERDALELEIIAEMQDIESMLVQENAVFRRLLQQAAMQILFYIGLILLVLVLRVLIRKVVQRATTNMGSRRKEAFRRFATWSLNLLLALVLLGIVFSQIAAFLPFLALLGTGVAFAVRGPIASFLAWFFIDTDNGFRVGDVIELGGVTGRVKEITPLLTVLRERKHNAETGNIITVPNSSLLEQSMVNKTRFYQFTRKEVMFYLAHGVNTAAAESTLSTILDTNLEDIKKDLERRSLEIQREFRLTGEDLQPRVWITQGEKYIELHARFFCPFKDLNERIHSIERETLTQLATSLYQG